MTANFPVQRPLDQYRARLQPGAKLHLLVSRLDGAEHLPVVELKRAA